MAPDLSAQCAARMLETGDRTWQDQSDCKADRVCWTQPSTPRESPTSGDHPTACSHSFDFDSIEPDAGHNVRPLELIQLVVQRRSTRLRSPAGFRARRWLRGIGRPGLVYGGLARICGGRSVGSACRIDCGHLPSLSAWSNERFHDGDKRVDRRGRDLRRSSSKRRQSQKAAGLSGSRNSVPEASRPEISILRAWLMSTVGP